MAKRTRYLNVRLTDGERSRVDRIAKSKQMTPSELVRALVQLPGDCVSGDFRTAVVLDRASLPRLEREMRRWGNHYNQAVHALNRIAYYAERGSLRVEEARRLLRLAEGNLEDLNAAVVDLRNDVKGITRHAVVSL